MSSGFATVSETVEDALEAIIRAYREGAKDSLVNSTTPDIPKMARDLAGAWAADPKAGRVPARFRDVTSNRVKAELRRLSRLAEGDDLSTIIEGLHQPTIVALADHGCFILGRHRQDGVQIVASAKIALSALRRFRGTARLSTPVSIPPQRRRRIKTLVLKGAPENRRARFVRELVAKHYKLLTGKNATMSGRIADLGRPAGGKFLILLQCVFRALNIEASAELQAALAAYRKRKTPINTNY